MQKKYIQTHLGKIAVYVENVSGQKTPVLFAHGIYLDHNLWQHQVDALSDRPAITIDMPLHGESEKNINKNWTIRDCCRLPIIIPNYSRLLACAICP